MRGLAIGPAGALLAGLTLSVGLLVAADWRLPMALLLGLVGLTGAILGFSQIAELRSSAFAAGAALAVGLSLVYGVTLIRRINAPWARIAVRIAGSWLVAIQAMMLGLALR